MVKSHLIIKLLRSIYLQRILNLERERSLLDRISSLTKAEEKSLKAYNFLLENSEIERRLFLDESAKISFNLTKQIFLKNLEWFESLKASTDLKRDKFLESWSKFGISEIEVDEDTEFDGSLHEPVNHSSSNLIDKLLRPGYLLNGKCVRAALVQIKPSEG